MSETMKNIAGQPVRGRDFFERPILCRQFHQLIESGSSILISAPRRVGKTSLMFHVHDEGMQGYHFIYDITQSVNSENEYFRRLGNRIFDEEFLTTIQKFTKKTSRSLKGLGDRVSEIGKTIKLDKESKRNYLDEFIDSIKSIDLEGQRIVFMIDEFSQTLENIIQDEGERSAIHFLQVNRELRQDPVINQKIQFIYAGSIGLENIVSRLNAVDHINDLTPLKVPQLNGEEAHTLMKVLTGEKLYTLSKANMNYIMGKIQWYIPFYFQLAVMEISNLYTERIKESDTEKKKITKAFIDDAFSRMLELRSHFEHWEKRLRKAFKGGEYNFAKEILNIISEQEIIERSNILNLAQKFDITGTYKDIINSLVYDGYINNNDDARVYRFNSPLLKLWWRKNVAN